MAFMSLALTPMITVPGNIHTQYHASIHQVTVCHVYHQKPKPTHMTEINVSVSADVE